MVAVIAGLWSTACRPTAESPFRPRPIEEPVTVEVDNGGYLDVVVYALPDGAWHRLGSVTGLASAAFVVPSVMATAGTGFRLLVDPIGSDDAYFTEVIRANPGDRVELHVQSLLSLSSWSVR
jgi:hypothetical protein